MDHWKSHLIEAYRLMTVPYRQFRMFRMIKQGTVPIIILFYHRVANEVMNPWTISQENFERQIDWFQERFDIVDLEECQRRMTCAKNDKATLAITFDDGYAENCEFALPLLIERRIPVTYFVTTDHTTNQKPFPHDLERGHPLPVNTIESLRALELAGVEIGAHTRTHVDLGSVTCDHQLVDEVITASMELEAQIGRKIRYFAFPFGQVRNLNRNVFAMLKEAGFLGACSAYGGWNRSTGDPFHLQRIHGDPNFTRMKNWLTFDPRIDRIEKFNELGGSFDKSLLESALSQFNRRPDQPGKFPGLDFPINVPHPTNQL